MTSSARPLRRRPARVIPSALVSVVALAAGAFLAWALVVRLSEGSWPAPFDTGLATLLQTPLENPAVGATAVVLSVLGIVLILCAVTPGRYRHYVVDVPADVYGGSHETVLTQRGLGNILRTRIARLDGVESANVLASGRRVSLTVRTPLHETSEITARVRGAAERTLAELPLVDPPALSVRVERTGR